MEWSSGKAIEMFSEYPEEMEVLLGPPPDQQLWRVEALFETDDAKRSRLHMLAAYCLTHLQVFVLCEL